MEPGNQLAQAALTSGFVINAPNLKDITGLIFLIILLFGSALMSASEVAFFSFRPEDIEKLKSHKGNKSRMAMKLYNTPEKLLSTVLVANNTINIAIVLLAAFLSSELFVFHSKVIGFLINVVVITFLLLFFGEVMPKVYASRNHVQVALFMAFPLNILGKILSPVTSVLIFSSSFVKKRAGNHHANLSMDDLSDALELTSDNFDDDEKILKGIVNFGNINVSAIMCPRIDVTSIDIKSTFDKIIPVIISSGYSRIPVYAGSFDNVKGVLYVKDILPYTNNAASFKWQALLRPPYFVPETKKINDLLKEFQTKRIHLAIVIDEYGGTSGIVTLEDILEEIVGEISDERDSNQNMYRKIDDKTYIFEGKIMLNDFCKIVDYNEELFEEVRGESETLAGLILELKGEIPLKGEIVKHHDFNFIIEASDRRRIKEIRVEIKKKESEADEK